LPWDISTGRFRRRLTIAFILVAGISAATIGLGAYVLVRDVRSDDFIMRSLRDAKANYLSVEDPAVVIEDEEIPAIIKRFERRGVSASVVIKDGREFNSDPAITSALIPDSMPDAAELDDDDSLPHANVAVAGTHYLVVATPQTSEGIAMYFFYSMSGLEAGLADLAGITWKLWIVVVVVAALVGNSLARRTLRPVSRASVAARSLAEGLLDTRLPVDREDEFGAWAVSFNEMADALETKISELTDARDRERRFTSDVSHELKTPLTALLSAASMLEQKLEGMDEDASWTARRMISGTRRIKGLVDELLEISRLRSGREVLRPTEVDLGLVIDSIIATQGWTDTVAYEPQSLPVTTDKTRVERVISNLIGNAVEHGKVKPRVDAGMEDGWAWVEVRDEGPGIPPEHIDHIFERFYKADSARRGGSGLGLAIAAEHARLLGGKVEVSSEPSRGTIFTLRLPSGADV
jgi:signal transduction histidine kinase